MTSSIQSDVVVGAGPFLVSSKSSVVGRAVGRASTVLEIFVRAALLVKFAVAVPSFCVVSWTAVRLDQTLRILDRIGISVCVSQLSEVSERLGFLVGRARSVSLKSSPELDEVTLPQALEVLVGAGIFVDKEFLGKVHNWDDLLKTLGIS